MIEENKNLVILLRRGEREREREREREDQWNFSPDIIKTTVSNNRLY
jgi:hypothetical protein